MPTSASGYRLLVVEDEATIRFALREYFTAQGWVVSCAASVVEGREKLATTEFDVAILDLHLEAGVPDSGLVLAQYLKDFHPLTRNILLTAYGSKEIRARALASGIAKVLDKPTRLWELCNIARELAEGAAQ